MRVGFFCVLCFAVVGCNSANDASSGSELTLTTRQGNPNSDRAPRLDYVSIRTEFDFIASIYEREQRPPIKRSVEVRLTRKITDAELREIAEAVKSLDRRRYERTFIEYLLPHMTSGSGAWATTHFNPTLHVRMLSETDLAGSEPRSMPVVPFERLSGHWLVDPLVWLIRQKGTEIVFHWKNRGPGVDSADPDNSSAFENNWLTAILLRPRTGAGVSDATKAKVTDPAMRSSADQTHAPHVNAIPVTPKQTIQEIELCRFLRTQLRELDEIRASDSFAQYGFGGGGPHSNWLRTMQTKNSQLPKGLRKNPGFRYCVAVGEVMQIGLEYVRSGGRETAYTRMIRPEIEELIQPR